MPSPPATPFRTTQFRKTAFWNLKVPENPFIKKTLFIPDVVVQPNSIAQKLEWDFFLINNLKKIDVLYIFFYFHSNQAQCRTCSQTGYTTEVDVFSSYQLSYKNDKTQTECATECDNELYCISFQYDTNIKRCYLKYANIGTPRRVTNSLYSRRCGTTELNCTVMVIKISFRKFSESSSERIFYSHIRWLIWPISCKCQTLITVSF